MSHQGKLLLNPKKRPKRFNPLRVLTSPKTTLVLGGILGTLLFPAAALGLVKGVGRALAPTTLRKAVLLGVTLPAGIGVLTSPRARRFVKKTFDPREQFRRGKEIGKVIEDPSRLLPSDDITTRTVGEKIKDIAIKTGLIGGAVAATVGAGALLVPAVRGALTRRRERREEQPITFQQLTPLGGAVVSSGAALQPLGAVEKPPEEEKVPAMLQPSIKIINKPQNNIDIRFSKKKTFINQQVLIKS